MFFFVNSTITTWGKEGEKDAFRNMLEQVGCNESAHAMHCMQDACSPGRTQAQYGCIETQSASAKIIFCHRGLFSHGFATPSIQSSFFPMQTTQNFLLHCI